jgi:hypothetical protein
MRETIRKPTVWRRQSVVSGTTYFSGDQSIGESTLDEQDMCDFAANTVVGADVRYSRQESGHR